MAYSRKFSKKIVLAAVVVVVLGAGITWLALKQKDRETIPVVAVSSSDKKTKESSSKKSDKTIPATNGSPANNSSKGSSPSSTSLQTPYGTFVSNHRPSLGGPTSEQSVCITSPGADCYIEFINGSSVKQLPTQKAGSDGSVYWSWDIKQAGLGAGTWQIKATATLNGQTKSSEDSMGLVIQ